MSANDEKMILMPLDPLTRLLESVQDIGKTAQAVIIPSEFHECEVETPEGPPMEELEAIQDRLFRIFLQLHRFHPAKSGEASPAPKRKSSSVKGKVTSVIVVAGIRLALDKIEALLARIAPHESSGASADWKFHGKVKMSRADGEAIRTEYQRDGEGVYQRWCLDASKHSRGVPGGKGVYTKMQVAAAIAHGAGGHLRRTQMKEARRKAARS